MMQKFDSNMQAIQVYLQDFHTIPTLQREYEWTIGTEVDEFWNDLYNNLILDGFMDQYFLASTIRYPTGDVLGGHPEYGIIDGQQRTITLMIMVAAFRDLAEKYGASPVFDACKQLLKEAIMGNVRMTSKKPKDTDVLDEVMDYDKFAPAFSSKPKYGASNDHLIRKAYKFLRDSIETALDDDTSGATNDTLLAQWYSRLMTSVVVSVIDAPDYSTAFHIFMTMHDRGKSMAPCHMVRAEVLMRGEKKNPTVGQAVLKKWEDLEEGEEVKFLTNFLGDFAVIETGKPVNSRGIHTKYVGMLAPLKSKAQLTGFCQDLKKFKKEYKFYTGKDEMHTFADVIRMNFRRGALILTGAKLSGATKPELGQIQHVIECVYAHQLAGSIDANVLKLPLIKWAHIMHTGGVKPGRPVPPIADRIKTMKADLKTHLLVKDAFVSGLVTNKSFDKKMNEAQFLLRRLEYSLAGGGKKIMGRKAVNIEHIYPKAAKASEWAVSDPDLLHHIGNLTLCDENKNKALGNKSWVKKKGIMLKRADPFVISNATWIDTSLTDWDNGAILARGEKVAEALYDYFQF